MRPARIAFVYTHPVQYAAPLFRYLNEKWGGGVAAIYLSDYSVRGGRDSGFGTRVTWDIDLLDGYEARFVGGAERRDEPTRFFSMLAATPWRELRAGGFGAVIVHGHVPAAMVLAAVAAKIMRIPVFMRCDTHLGLRRSRLKQLFRKPAMHAYYRLFDGVLAVGAANREFYRAMGVPERRIFTMPYAVDNRRFAAASTLPPSERRALRAALGVADDRPIVLYAAKLQRRKRPDDLMRAAASLNAERVSFHLVIVGSGEMDGELRELERDLDMRNIRFCGFVNQSALPRYYAACDVFVLPSMDEPWGLAINEAMCAGLPIVASAETGCVPDLVHAGRNGHTFTAGDAFGLANALRPLLADAELRRRFGSASRDIISGWSYAECDAGLRAAVASVGLAPGGALPSSAAAQ